MADFDDTTGWLEELDAWYSSEEYKSKAWSFSTGEGDTRENMAREHVIPLVELILQDSECQEALGEITRWEKDNPFDKRDENTPPFPRLTSNTIRRFIGWYLYKTGMRIGAGIALDTSVEHLARYVARSQIDAGDFDVPFRPIDNFFAHGQIAAGDHAAMNAYLDATEASRLEYQEERQREAELRKERIRKYDEKWGRISHSTGSGQNLC